MQKLSYQHIGGGGLCWQRSEILAMPVSDAIWHAEDLARTEKAEFDKIRKENEEITAARRR